MTQLGPVEERRTNNEKRGHTESTRFRIGTTDRNHETRRESESIPGMIHKLTDRSATAGREEGDRIEPEDVNMDNNSINTAWMKCPTQLRGEENDMSNRQENLTREREEQEVYTGKPRWERDQPEQAGEKEDTQTSLKRLKKFKLDKYVDRMQERTRSWILF